MLNSKEIKPKPSRNKCPAYGIYVSFENALRCESVLFDVVIYIVQFTVK